MDNDNVCYIHRVGCMLSYIKVVTTSVLHYFRYLQFVATGYPQLYSRYYYKVLTVVIRVITDE